MLYSDRIFSLHYITLLGLSVSIPQHQFGSIRKLDLDGLDIEYLDTYYYLDYIPSLRRKLRLKKGVLLQHKLQYDFALESKKCFESYSADAHSLYSSLVPTAWNVACIKVLPRMTSLTELRIKLTANPVSGVSVTHAREKHVLGPLWAVRLPNIRIFEVTVNWDQGTRGVISSPYATNAWKTQMAQWGKVDFKFEEGEEELRWEDAPFTLVRDRAVRRELTWWW